MRLHRSDFDGASSSTRTQSAVSRRSAQKMPEVKSWMVVKSWTAGQSPEINRSKVGQVVVCVIADEGYAGAVFGGIVRGHPGGC
jgi:hypothetical protein